MSDPFKELQDSNRIWQFKNNTNTEQTIQLANNETVQVQPRAVIKLQSNRFHQLPSMKLFRYIAPTIDDVKAVGLLVEKVGTTITAGPSEKTIPTDSEE